MRTNADKKEWGSDCMQTSTTLLGTKASRAGIQQWTAILITNTVTVLTVLYRPLWSLNLSSVTCIGESATSHPDYMVYLDADVRIGEEGVSQMRTKADNGEGGVKNRIIFVDVFMDGP